MDLNLYLGVAESLQIGSESAIGSTPASESPMSDPQEYSPFFPSYDPPISSGGPTEDSSRIEHRFRRLIDSARRLRESRAHLLPPELPKPLKTEEKVDFDKKIANFECNICFEMAEEPVVTSCGHLFCWPCLFQWLYVHSGHKECPVCKGEVTESNITPIYGKGSSEGSEVSEKREPSFGFRIPPRPRGNRLESVPRKNRERSRTLREGIATSWRRLMSQEREGGSSGLFDDGPHSVLTRLRRARESENVGIRRESDSIDIWNALSLNEVGVASGDRLALAAANILRRGSTSVDPVNPEEMIRSSNVGSSSATEQASGSSTIAVIQGDVGVLNGPLEEPNSAGSSRPYRRRGRINASEYLDADEVFHPASKRRRLN